MIGHTRGELPGTVSSTCVLQLSHLCYGSMLAHAHNSPPRATHISATQLQPSARSQAFLALCARFTCEYANTPARAMPVPACRAQRCAFC